MADILNAVREEFAFFQLEGDTVFHEDVANAFKQMKKSSQVGGPQ